jgi:hypothetical protein
VFGVSQKGGSHGSVIHHETWWFSDSSRNRPPKGPRSWCGDSEAAFFFFGFDHETAIRPLMWPSYIGWRESNVMGMRSLSSNQEWMVQF